MMLTTLTILKMLVARNRDDAYPIEHVHDADNAETFNDGNLMLILLKMMTMRD